MEYSNVYFEMSLDFPKDLILIPVKSDGANYDESLHDSAGGVDLFKLSWRTLVN